MNTTEDSTPKIRIYLSAPVTGRDPDEVIKTFEQMEAIVRRAGGEPVNPLKLTPYVSNPEYADYMARDVAELMRCDAALFSCDYWQSRGCEVERSVCIHYRIPIGYNSASGSQTRVDNASVLIRKAKARRAEKEHEKPLISDSH